jgi:hypothetical protein
MLPFNERKKNAQKFVGEWRGRGKELEEDRTFWNQFLQEVLGIERVHHEIEYQKPVKVKKSTKRLDAYIASSKVLIEQKSIGTDLRKAEKQSDGEYLTPYEQALRYATYLPSTDTPDFIITSNFESFLIYDRRNDPNGQNPVEVGLEELPDQLSVFTFIIDPINVVIEKQTQVSKEAAALIGKIYEEIKNQYIDPEKSHGDLAALMVRILFCLYAEDSGLFEKDAFYNYLKEIPAGQGMFRKALIELFGVLDTPKDKRDPYTGELLAQFPYVNGGLFAGEIEIPIFTDAIKHKLLDETGHHFNWSKISPVIFGSIFESILSGEERRAGGMHYTSVQNIRKLIDPLFLDDIVTKLYAAGNDKDKLRALQDEIASLTFLDPAMGSGNFLTQTLIELRKIENEILKRLVGEAQIEFARDDLNAKVSVGQFYGIEINEFAVAVANAALWIAEHQANVETSSIVNRRVETLPLIDYKHLHQGNALTIEWETVIPKTDLSFIIGNPPFIGSSMMTATQKQEAVAVFGKIKLSNSMDYVGAWYHKAAAYIQGTQICVAFVSTNSITQGEQVAPLWGKMFDEYKVHINFAYRTFRWDNETKGQAAVHCVIIGFSNAELLTDSPKIIYKSNGGIIKASNINAYLVDAANVVVVSRGTPLCDVPRMYLGNKPSDGGNLILTPEERDFFILKEPQAEKFIKPYIGSVEFINNKIRYCIWLKDVPYSEIKDCPYIIDRIEKVREFRLASSAKPTVEKAETPHLFFFISQPESEYLLIPSVSSENRKYIPIGYMDKDTISSNLNMILPNATLYHFGILTSNIHNAWMRAVGGRLKSDYRYSAAIVYNTFPWPTVSEEQQKEIGLLANNILDARLQYTDNSLADMYGKTSMPFYPELVKAHKALDRAVIKLYGGEHWKFEADCVADLMQRYQELSQKE